MAATAHRPRTRAAPAVARRVGSRRWPLRVLRQLAASGGHRGLRAGGDWRATLCLRRGQVHVRRVVLAGRTLAARRRLPQQLRHVPLPGRPLGGRGTGADATRGRGEVLARPVGRGRLRLLHAHRRGTRISGSRLPAARYGRAGVDRGARVRHRRGHRLRSRTGSRLDRERRGLGSRSPARSRVGV
jgi:hypothetical protein